MKTSSRWNNWEMPFALTLSGALSLAVYAHLFFGVSVGDESFYAVTALLPALGGKWYQTEILFQQTAGMLYAPILFAYHHWFGTTGILLFLRHLEFALSVFVAYQVYLTLRIYNRPAVALILSSLVVTFVPHALQSLSYNTIGSLFFALAGALSVRGYLVRSPKLAFAAGCVWVLDGFAYPTLVVSALLFGALAFAASCADPSRRRQFLYPLAFGVLLTSVPLLGLLIYLGVDHIQNAIAFSAAYNHPGWWKIPFTLKLAYGYLPAIWASAPWLAGLIGIALYRRDLLGAWLALGLLGFFISGPEGEAASIQVLLAGLPLLGLFLLRPQLRRRERLALAFVVLPSLVGAVVACLGSRATLYVMCVPGLAGSLFAMALFIGRRRVGGLICAVTLTVFATLQLWSRFYEDDVWSQLNYTFHSGPMAGLTTFEKKGRFIEAIQSDLAENHIVGQRIVFRDFFLLGYLMSPNMPSGPTQYLGPAVFFPEIRALYVQVFREAAETPDVVVELASYPAKHDQDWNYSAPNEPGGFNRYFADSGLYKILVQRATHRIWVRAR